MNQNIKKIGIRILIPTVIFTIIRIIIKAILNKSSFYNNNLVIPSDFYIAYNQLSTAITSIAFAGILFLLYNKNNLINKEISKLNKRECFLFILTSIFFLVLHYSFKFYINHNLDFALKVPILFALIKLSLNVFFVLFLYLAFIQTKYSMYLMKLLIPKPIFIISPILIFLTLRLFRKLWPFFSNAVAKSLEISLKIFYNDTSIIPNLVKDGPILSSGGFTVQIGSSCSGIDSLLMFIGLYVIFYFLDKEKINTKNYWIIFPIGLIGIFLFNILRLFLLMLVGIHISPEIAAGLFHQNIGWIVFIVFFAIFWTFTKDRIYKKE